MEKSAKILLVGHGDIIENSLYDYLVRNGFESVTSASLIKLDIHDQKRVQDYFSQTKPDYVFLASTRSGGIEANQKLRGEFIYSNLRSQTNVIHAAHKSGVKKLLFFSSSCVYPQKAPQPIKEESLLTGPLEPTSEPYSVAKIAGIKLCQSYRDQYKFNAVIMIPATIYGPGANTDLATAHVMGALIAKFHQAVKDKKKEVTVLGTGKPYREFLYVEDFVQASQFLMEKYDGREMINVGTGEEIAIKELARLIAKVAGFKGKIVFDTSKPDGVLHKLLDNSRMSKLGWKPTVNLEEGIKRTYWWYSKSTK